MAELSIDEALGVLNTARTYLSSAAVDIFISCDNALVEVSWLTDAPDGALHDFLVTVDPAAEVVNNAMGEGDKMFLAEDHKGRWVLIPND